MINMFYAIKAIDTDLYVVMDVETGALSWGAKEDSMVFSLHSQAGAFADNNLIEDWEVTTVDFGY